MHACKTHNLPAYLPVETAPSGNVLRMYLVSHPDTTAGSLLLLTFTVPAVVPEELAEGSNTTIILGQASSSSQPPYHTKAKKDKGYISYHT